MAHEECRPAELSQYCDELKIRVRILSGMLIEVSRAIGHSPDLDRILHDTIGLIGRDPRSLAERVARDTLTDPREVKGEVGKS